MAFWKYRFLCLTPQDAIYPIYSMTQGTWIHIFFSKLFKQLRCVAGFGCHQGIAMGETDVCSFLPAFPLPSFSSFTHFIAHFWAFTGVTDTRHGSFLPGVLSGEGDTHLNKMLSNNMENLCQRHGIGAGTIRKVPLFPFLQFLSSSFILCSKWSEPSVGLDTAL